MKRKNLSSAEKKLIDKNRRTVGKAVNRYNLITEGDRIAVGISGGKDSYVLFETLAERLRFLPIKYEIFPVHIGINEIPYSLDEDYVSGLCESMGLKFHLRRISVNFDEPEKSGTNPCFYCSWNRRKELFNFCRENGCNKLALGHHMDDAIETLLLNMIYQGAISSMPAELNLFEGEVKIIRPLILLSEYLIARQAEARQYPPQKKMCPFAESSGRNSVKAIIREMEKLNPMARNSMFSAMSNIHGEYLPAEAGKRILPKEKY